MSGPERHRRMETARVRAALSIQQLWLRYVSLGGTGDAFDVDGHLQGIVPLSPFQQDVLAQALNEALADDYHAHRVPLSTTPPEVHGGDGLRPLIDRLLADPDETGADGRAPAPEDGPAAASGEG